jgi:hypothetical protein
MQNPKVKTLVSLILVLASGLISVNLYNTWKEMSSVQGRAFAVKVDSSKSTSSTVKDTPLTLQSDGGQEFERNAAKHPEISSGISANGYTAPAAPGVDVPASFAVSLLKNITNKEMVEDLANISRDFSQEMSNSGLNPYDSKYQAKWNEEKEKADTKIRQLYGQDLLNKLQTISPTLLILRK